jgi:hypothetical protein
MLRMVRCQGAAASVSVAAAKKNLVAIPLAAPLACRSPMTEGRLDEAQARDWIVALARQGRHQRDID